jgi:hypothetical protein
MEMESVPLYIEDDDVEEFEESPQMVFRYEGENAVISFLDSSGREFLAISTAPDTREVQILSRQDQEKPRRLLAAVTSQITFTGITCFTDEEYPNMICVADHLKRSISIDAVNTSPATDNEADTFLPIKKPRAHGLRLPGLLQPTDIRPGNPGESRAPLSAVRYHRSTSRQ